MSDWREKYSSKLITAAQAVRKIKPGNRVFIGSACGEPQELTRAMATEAATLSDTEVVHVLTLGVAPYADPHLAPSFRANAFFIGNSLRDAVNDARADYTPVFLSEVPALFRSNRFPVDVAFIMVSPPDEHGVCSLGVSVDITKPAVESSKLIIAQVNRHMPRTHGESFIHIDKIGFLVEKDELLLEWPVTPGEGDEVIEAIAANIARLVPDGATLQIGIGRIPNATLSALKDRRDLGVHTEMMSDGVMQLAEAGVITGKRKSLHPGKIVASFAAGSQKLFEFVHDNPSIEMRSSDYTNDVRIISQHENMIAINAALEVDLTGQVVADSLGEKLFSGIGGHADFMRGAALAKGGKPIIAMPSTALTSEGVKSRIVSNIAQGAGVITTRGDAHYIVTEYGVAYLHGRSMRERAMSLVGVAHPDYRGELLHAAKRRRIVYPNQILPPTRAPYPQEYEERLALDGGEDILVRPIRAADEPLVKSMFYRFSEQTVYLRYHTQLKSMPHNKLQVFCNVDYETEMALVCQVGAPGAESLIAVGRYMTDPSKDSAEVAFVVEDEWQRKGIGTYLFNRLVKIASEKGIRNFGAYVLVENSGMLKIFHQSGLSIETNKEEDVIRVTMKLPTA